MRRSAIAILLALAACRPPEVVRVVDGVPVEGRFVPDAAYAAYARAAELEARDKPIRALRAYLQAASFDPDGVELWVRIAALRCRLGAWASAAEAFEAAAERDASYEPLWRERARCAERHERLDQAVAAARRAVAADPDRVATVLLLARLLDATGAHQEAARLLRSLSLQHPQRIEIWEHIVEHAARTDAAAWSTEAAAEVARLAGRADPRRRPEGWDGVDAALQTGELAAVRRAALRARLDLRKLPARAILGGRPGLAAEEAGLRLRADPSDGDARVALALATDLRGRRREALRLIADLAATDEPLSPPSRWLLGELMWRHVGPDAAAAYLGRSIASREQLREGLAASFGPRRREESEP